VGPWDRGNACRQRPGRGRGLACTAQHPVGGPPADVSVLPCSGLAWISAALGFIRLFGRHRFARAGTGSAAPACGEDPMRASRPGMARARRIGGCAGWPAQPATATNPRGQEPHGRSPGRTQAARPDRPREPQATGGSDRKICVPVLPARPGGPTRRTSRPTGNRATSFTGLMRHR
jgi:hypothetical protein